MGEFDKHFKIIFNDRSYQMRLGTDYTKETINAVPPNVNSKIRAIIAEIFDNKESEVKSIEINVDCDIPFYTNNDTFYNARISLVSTYVSYSGLLFSNLTNLTNIVVHQNNPYFSSINGVLFSKDGKILYTYPPAKSGNEYSIPSNVEKINCLSFMNTSNLNNIEISNRTTTDNVGIAAFANATGLMRITIPDNVTQYHSYSFYRCKKLTTFTASNRIIFIGAASFYECTELLTVTFPNHINKQNVDFHSLCFFNCSKLYSISLPDTTRFHEE